MVNSPITFMPCLCGHRGCHDYHLVGIGKFLVGSGFTLEEAEEICVAVNLVRQRAEEFLRE